MLVHASVVNGLRARHRLARIGHQFDFSFGFAGYALTVRNNIRQWRIFRRCGDAKVNAEARCQINERVANVISVADVGEFESAQSAEFFLEREKIGKRLAGMKLVGKRVDHRDASVRGHFFEHALVVDAGDNAMNPALKLRATSAMDSRAPRRSGTPAYGRGRQRSRPCSGCRRQK